MKNIGLLVAMLALPLFAVPSCAVMDGGDLDALIEEINRMPPESIADLKQETAREAVLENLRKRDKRDVIGQIECMYKEPIDPKNPAGPWKDSDETFDIGGDEFSPPRVKDLIDCFMDRIETKYPSYGKCLYGVMKAKTKEAEETIRRLSEDPNHPNADTFYGRWWMCYGAPFREYDPSKIIEPEDMDHVDRMAIPALVQLLFGLEEAPAILYTAEFLEALGVALCLLSEDEQAPAWGCNPLFADQPPAPSGGTSGDYP